MAPKVALVTHATQGLALALIESLSQQLTAADIIYLTGRDTDRVTQAAGALLDLVFNSGLGVDDRGCDLPLPSPTPWAGALQPDLGEQQVGGPFERAKVGLAVWPAEPGDAGVTDALALIILVPDDAHLAGVIVGLGAQVPVRQRVSFGYRRRCAAQL
ncbi:hypothetical protein MXD59_20610 [Frankia sp. Ag45/Mut15]|uniref:Uncharacterized protein n=1 Tax=Frankia umida TaxID=573489 RepID=A0ABT0K3Q9_9ACTN|nr:hypothetical protein [Frankia umida]MCK9878139.1 hypothetical protein [Frankia umida]